MKDPMWFSLMLGPVCQGLGDAASKRQMRFFQGIQAHTATQLLVVLTSYICCGRSPQTVRQGLGSIANVSGKKKEKTTPLGVQYREA